MKSVCIRQSPPPKPRGIIENSNPTFPCKTTTTTCNNRLLTSIPQTLPCTRASESSRAWLLALFARPTHTPNTNARKETTTCSAPTSPRTRGTVGWDTWPRCPPLCSSPGPTSSFPLGAAGLPPKRWRRHFGLRWSCPPRQCRRPPGRGLLALRPGQDTTRHTFFFLFLGVVFFVVPGFFRGIFFSLARRAGAGCRSHEQ